MEQNYGKMILLQTDIGLSKEGMYMAAIGALVAAILWLALYIRKMHNKTIEYLKDDKEKMIQVISKNTSSAEQQARSIDRLGEVMGDLKDTILIQNRKSDR
jgi:hypothetical protein